MSELEEKQIGSELLYDGVVIHLYKDKIELPNGREATREYVKNNQAIAVVALTDDDEIIMERQFRYPFRKEIIEIPAGKMEDGEAPDEAARRELSEETGIECASLVHIGDYYPSVAIMTEVIHLFLAKDLIFKERHLDEDEFLDVFKVP